MGNKERPIKALSEIVLRVKNLKARQEFYENTRGLELLQQFDNIVELVSYGESVPSL